MRVMAVMKVMEFHERVTVTFNGNKEQGGNDNDCMDNQAHKERT